MQPLLHRVSHFSQGFQYKVIYRVLHWALSWSWELQYNICMLQHVLLSPKGFWEAAGYRVSPRVKICVYSSVLKKQHTSVYIPSLFEDKRSVNIFPKEGACRNLASQVSQQLLSEHSRWWGQGGWGPPGAGAPAEILPRHSEGQVAVLPEAIRWRRNLRWIPHLCH